MQNVIELEPWRRNLIERLERAIGRRLADADMSCISWNELARTLTVGRPPLRDELKSHNLISNIFRTPRYPRAYQH